MIHQQFDGCCPVLFKNVFKHTSILRQAPSHDFLTLEGMLDRRVCFSIQGRDTREPRLSTVEIANLVPFMDH
jgi:hypothetical protein